MNKPLSDEQKVALITEAKEKSAQTHAGKSLFLAEYSFTGREGRTEHLCFVFREPDAAQMQLYSEQASRDSMGANEQLLYSLLVLEGKDDRALPLREQIGPHTAAVGTFVQEYLNPLFGVPLEAKPLVAL
ncbi:MAG: hypothetical protein AAF975_00085 [Spirochaetota bacterium]